MTDKQPTQEQIKEFWEWCGIRYEADQDCFKVIFPDSEWYNFGSDWKMGEIEPSIDLNNLFKWAVPKVMGLGYGFNLSDFCSRPPYLCSLYHGYNEGDEKVHIIKSSQDPAQALFRALWQVKEKSKWNRMKGC